MPRRSFPARVRPDTAVRLLPVVHELSLARDLAAVTRVVRTAGRDLTGADGVSFVLRDNDQCYYADEDAVAPLWKGMRFPLDQCISGWVMTRDEPAIVPDVYADARVPHDVYQSTFVRSLAMVPVRAPDAIAAVGAYWARTHRTTDEELDALTMLADSAALALTNVQLYQRLDEAAHRERRARVAAEAAVAAKDEFLAVVSHELRQPLHASVAALRMMAAHSDGASGERARSIVERQLTLMTRLVDDLLDASRIVQGHVELRQRPLDLRRLLEQVLESVRPVMKERRHEFAVSLPEGSVPVVADGARLQQVFANLLMNAARYTDPGGRVYVQLERCTNHVAVSVSDTGRGIEPEALEGIFDLFTRAAPDVPGFGVGLAVSRRLVELHGGTIDARSAGANHGSTFTVRLPARGVGTGPATDDASPPDR